MHKNTFTGGQFGNVSEVFNIVIPFDLVILLLGIYLKEIKISIPIYVQECLSQHYL